MSAYFLTNAFKSKTSCVLSIYNEHPSIECGVRFHPESHSLAAFLNCDQNTIQGLSRFIITVISIIIFIIIIIIVMFFL